MKRSMPSKRALLKRAVIVSLFCSSGVQCAPFSRLPHFRGWWMTGAILFPEYAWKLNFLVFCVMGLILHFRKVFPNPHIYESPIHHPLTNVMACCDERLLLYGTFCSEQPLKRWLHPLWPVFKNTIWKKWAQPLGDLNCQLTF